ncbi:MAG: hypothetical protein ABR569_06895 [Gaiellaceae bacterium]
MLYQLSYTRNVSNRKTKIPAQNLQLGVFALAASAAIEQARLSSRFSPVVSR